MSERTSPRFLAKTALIVVVTLTGIVPASVASTDQWFVSASAAVDLRDDALNQADFSDIAGTVFESAIEWLAEQGITTGCNPPANTRFCPDDPVTRGEMAVFISRAIALPAPADDQFIDDSGLFYEAAANRLYGAGITAGCNPPTNNRFCGEDQITREQMAAFLVRAFDVPSTSIDFFIDDEISLFESAINRIAAAGITVGCNPPANNMFCPGDFVTRGQMAAFFKRALEPSEVAPAARCDFSAGTTSFHVVLDLDGDGKAEIVDMSASDAATATLSVDGGDGQFSHAMTSFSDLGTAAFGDLIVADVTGDGLPDVIACVQVILNTFATDIAILSADNGVPRIVMDSGGALVRGELEVREGVLALLETHSLFAGECVWAESTTYRWNGAIFVPTEGSTTTVTDSHPDCDSFISPGVGNRPPTPGFVMSFTDRGAREGEVLLVEGPDAGDLVVLCEGPGSFCAPRSFDPDGTIETYSWYLNGKSLNWTPPGLVSMSLFEDGINTVTLQIVDDDGAETYVTGFVERDRP